MSCMKCLVGAGQHMWPCGPVLPQPSQVIWVLHGVYARVKQNSSWVYPYLKWCVAILKSHIPLCMFQGSARSRYWHIYILTFYVYGCFGQHACLCKLHFCGCLLALPCTRILFLVCLLSILSLHLSRGIILELCHIDSDGHSNGCVLSKWSFLV